MIVEEGYPPLPEGMHWSHCTSYPGDININRDRAVNSVHIPGWWDAGKKAAAIRVHSSVGLSTKRIPFDTKEEGMQYLSAYFMLGMDEQP